jgi:hypothetical protein
VSENRTLRRIFGPEREKVAGNWRRLHNEELHNLYSSRILLGSNVYVDLYIHTHILNIST